MSISNFNNKVLLFLLSGIPKPRKQDVRQRLTGELCIYTRVALAKLAQSIFSTKYKSTTKFLHALLFFLLFAFVTFSDISVASKHIYVCMCVYAFFIYSRIFNGKYSAETLTFICQLRFLCVIRLLPMALKNLVTTKEKETYLPLIDLTNSNKFAHFEHFLRQLICEWGDLWAVFLHLHL